jgi:hypothetical protein
MEAAEDQRAEAELDVERNRQRLAPKLSAGAWKPDDHPELAEGGAVYIERIRSEPDRS